MAGRFNGKLDRFFLNFGEHYRMNLYFAICAHPAGISVILHAASDYSLARTWYGSRH
jgi:hypothetical protein